MRDDLENKNYKLKETEEQCEILEAKTIYEKTSWKITNNKSSSKVATGKP